MKKSKIIVPALAMLVMSTAATVTGTVAWFSMNKTVTADGMNVKATSDSSLVISNSSTGPFSSNASANLTATTMKPSTSYDGLNFGYLSEGVEVENAGAAGATWTGDEGAFDSDDLTLVSSAGTYYVTTTYYLKSLAEDKTVYLKSFNITGANGSNATVREDFGKTLRLSVTVNGTTKVYAAPSGQNRTEGVGKYTPADAENSTPASWELATKTYDTVWSGSSFGTLTHDTNYSAVVNIWFEGQDVNCYSDNCTGSDYSIVLTFTTDAAA